MEFDQSARYSDFCRKEGGLIVTGKPIFVAYQMKPKAGNR